MPMIFDLPRDLVMEIFSRVPLKHMRKVRLTCKKLNTLSKSETFSKMHIAKEEAAREGEYLGVFILDGDLSLMSVGDPSTEPKAKLSRLNEQVKIFKVFHCDGLLLCILKDDIKVVVWNPYLGQTRLIEPIYHPLQYRYERYKYALGYAKNTSHHRSHKFLRFLDDYVGARGVYEPREFFRRYEIYDFDSDKWTTLDVPKEVSISYHECGVSLKGNTYFCARETTLECRLICFDYTRESFGPLMPLPFRSTRDNCVTLSCVGKEKLAVLLTDDEENPHKLDVWITTNIGPEEVSWSKFMAFYIQPDSLISAGGFFIDEGKKVVMGFVYGKGRILHIFGEDGYFKRLVLVEEGFTNDWSGQMCSYVPSTWI